MTREEFCTKIAEKGYLLLDGGTGSVLRTMGMPAVNCKHNMRKQGLM